jgi:replicative DNA helicase
MSDENNTVVTTDHQRLVVSGLMKDSYLLSVIGNELNDGYFNDSISRIIYKSLNDFYLKYQKLPTEQELMLSIESDFIELGPDIGTVKSIARELFNAKQVDEQYLLDKCVEMIKKVRVNRTLNRTLEMIKNGTSLNSEKLTSDLISSLEVSFSKSGIFRLGDTEQLAEAREKAVGNNENKSIIRSVLPSINTSLQYRGYQRGTLNLIVSPPGTGKTSYLINEGSYAAMQGFNVMHVFLGDMIKYDGFIRYASCITGKKQDEITSMSSEDQGKLIKEIQSQYSNILDRIFILAYGSRETDVDSLIENIKKEQDRLGITFDDIIIDYADNFDKDDNKMYSEGGYIYDRLELFGRLNGSVMMVASQPKINYWNDEIIPLEGASESSRKQHIVDMIACFNTVQRGANIGTFFVPKVRRGTSGRLIRVETHWECCRINEISEDDYTIKKGQLNMN